MNVTKTLVEYCMDSQYPKQFHVTGSFGHHLVEYKHTDEDYYWINGYFVYKKWLHNYMREKFATGLKGVLFEPAYVIGPVDPGQKYMFWRIARLFATLEYAFQYVMLCTPIDMLIDHYLLALNCTHPGPNIICPFIPEPLNITKHMQELLPNLEVVDFDRFREIVNQRLPKKAKYFGPNMKYVYDGYSRRMFLFSHGQANVGMKTWAELTSFVAGYNNKRIITDSFGIGADFDTEIMKGITYAGGSRFVFLESAEVIESLVTKVLVGVFGACGSAARLIVRDKNGAAVTKIWGHENTVAGASLDELYFDNRLSVLCEFTTPNTTAAGENEIETLTYELRYSLPNDPTSEPM
ncbi:unnamed protein product, partial [Rotaria sp. Silwood1]